MDTRFLKGVLVGITLEHIRQALRVRRLVETGKVILVHAPKVK